jgi:hypothetical protein
MLGLCNSSQCPAEKAMFRLGIRLDIETKLVTLYFCAHVKFGKIQFEARIFHFEQDPMFGRLQFQITPVVRYETQENK